MPVAAPASAETALEAQAHAQALIQERKLRDFYRHLLQFVVTIGALPGLNLFKSPQHLWFL